MDCHITNALQYDITALCVTMASTETLNVIILGVNCFPPLPVPKVTPKTVPFSGKDLTA